MNVLDKIKAYKLEDVAARKLATPIGEVEARAREASPTRGFSDRLHEASRQGYGLIAESKRRARQRALSAPISIRQF